MVDDRDRRPFHGHTEGRWRELTKLKPVTYKRGERLWCYLKGGSVIDVVVQDPTPRRGRPVVSDLSEVNDFVAGRSDKVDTFIPFGAIRRAGEPLDVGEDYL